MKNALETTLQVAALGQALVAILNLSLVRILRWQAEVARMELLVREVFHIHAFFISLTLFIFAALTGRFAREMAIGQEPLARWLAAGIGLFWAIRAVLQVTYYSSSHWRGIPARTAVHIILLIVYGGWAVVYLTAAWGRI